MKLSVANNSGNKTVAMEERGEESDWTLQQKHPFSLNLFLMTCPGSDDCQKQGIPNNMVLC
jgi:hypothetical protein